MSRDTKDIATLGNEDRLQFTMRFGKLERQIIGLVVGCIAKFVTGSLFVFNVYQDVIKDTFNYTQKESKCSVALGSEYHKTIERYMEYWQ